METPFKKIEQVLLLTKSHISITGPAGCGKVACVKNSLLANGIPFYDIDMEGIGRNNMLANFYTEVSRNSDKVIVIHIPPRYHLQKELDGAIKLLMDASYSSGKVLFVSPELDIEFTFTGRVILISTNKVICPSILARSLYIPFYSIQESLASLLEENGYEEKSFNHYYKDDRDIILKDSMMICAIDCKDDFIISYSITTFEKLVENLKQFKYI